MLHSLFRPMFVLAAAPRPLLASLAPRSLLTKARSGLTHRPATTLAVARGRQRPSAAAWARFYRAAPRLAHPFPAAAAATEPAALPEDEQQAAGEGQDTMQPAAKKQRTDGQEGGKAAAPAEQSQHPQKKRGKKKQSPEMLARMAIHQAAKANDLGAALAAFDQAKADGLSLTADLYLSLLYLCSGGDAWEQLLRHEQPQQPQQEQQEQQAGAGAGAEGGDGAGAAANGGQAQAADQGAGPDAGSNGAAASAAGGEQQQEGQQEGGEQRGEGEGEQGQPAPQGRAVGEEERTRRAQELFDEMRASGRRLPLSEMCFTALARLAAARGDADRAFALAKEMVEHKIEPKLRSFTPALIAYAERGQADQAFEVSEAIASHQLDLTEPEFARLLQAAAAAPPSAASWERAAALLRRIGAELTVLQPDTLARARALFASPAAAQGGPWEVAATTVSPGGRCACCGGQLAALDLTPEEMQQFAGAIADIAERQERRQNAFQKFKAWLEEHGPFDAVVDGANVALFGQNFAQGGFNFGQIRAVLNHLTSRHPDARPLLLLHVGRTQSPQAREPENKALLERLSRERRFYVTPAGSNDDWYWIYAAVTAGQRGLLVSNDEMRDHIFQLLAPKYFLKWKQRHQVKFDFRNNLELFYPAPYTTCLQELECGAWVLPGADGSWLCAKRAAAAADAPAAADGDSAA